MENDIRIKDLTNTALEMASDDYIGIDGLTNGTRKIPFSGIMDSLDPRFATANKTPRGAIAEIKQIVDSHGNVIGSIKNMISDEYDDSADYDVGDYCIYDNVRYCCNTEISGGETWNSAHWDVAIVDDDVIEIKSSLSDLENITVGTPRKVGKWGNYDRYELWLEGTTPTMSANTWTQIKSYTFNTASIIEKVFTISDSGGLIFNDYYTSTTSYLTSYIKSDGIYLRVGNASAFTGQKFYCKVTYVS